MADVTQIDGQDLTGARLRMIRVKDARIRMLDASGAVLRDADLSGMSVDGANLDGLVVNGVEIGPLVEAELTRREPARALRATSDPAHLREAWAMLEESWGRTYARVAARPELAERPVDDEWTFTETLRHLVFATDAWLGAALGNDPRYHPWGVPFSDYTEFVEGGAEALGLDVTAAPSYDDVLALRQQQVARVRALLADVTPEQLAEEVEGPAWMEGGTVSVLRALWVVLDEEIEHHRFAQRDLDLLMAER